MPTRQDYKRILEKELRDLEKNKNQEKRAAGDGPSASETNVRAKNKQRQSA